MKHIKKLEKFFYEKNEKNEYYSDEEIIEFFQSFLDQHVFDYEIYDTHVAGTYYMEFKKSFSKSSLKYEDIENAPGYSDPDLILDKLSFLKDLDPIRKRLQNAGYIFNFEFEMSFLNITIDAGFNIILHGSYNSLKDNNYYV